MKNVAIIRVPSMTFSEGKMQEICERLRNRMVERGIECDEVTRSSGIINCYDFKASTSHGRFFVGVSMDGMPGQ